MDTTLRVAGRDARTATPDHRSRWVALLVLCVGMLMIVLDATVVNVALPSIQRCGPPEPTERERP